MSLNKKKPSTAQLQKRERERKHMFGYKNGYFTIHHLTIFVWQKNLNIDESS